MNKHLQMIAYVFELYPIKRLCTSTFFLLIIIDQKKLAICLRKRFTEINNKLYSLIMQKIFKMLLSYARKSTDKFAQLLTLP